MAAYKVVAVDENNRPQAGVNIYAVSLNNYPNISEVVQADLAGEAFFTGLVGPHFFWAQEIRTSTTVGERVYSGRLHVQITSLGQAPCFDYVVDSNGMGTHTSLTAVSADLDASSASGGVYNVWLCGITTESVSLTFPASRYNRLSIFGGGRQHSGITGTLTVSGMAESDELTLNDVSIPTLTATGVDTHVIANNCNITNLTSSGVSSGWVSSRFYDCTINSASSAATNNWENNLWQGCQLAVFDTTAGEAQTQKIKGCRFPTTGSIKIKGGGSNQIVNNDWQGSGTAAAVVITLMTSTVISDCLGNVISGNKFPVIPASGVIIDFTGGGQVGATIGGGNSFGYGGAAMVNFIRSSGTTGIVTVVGNAFEPRDAASRLFAENDGHISISGKFTDSTFGPNTPACFDLELLAGSADNFYYGCGTVSGAGASSATVVVTDATFLVLAAHSGLSAARVFTPRNNIFGDDLGAGAAYLLDSWLKGADIASANPLVLGTDGDYFHVTGTTGIAGISPYFDTALLALTPGAYWLANEGSGNLADSSGNGNTMTAAGAPTYGATGPLPADADTAITLDGANANYFEAATSASLDVADTFSIVAWIKKAVNGQQRVIISRGSTGYELEMTATNTLQLVKSGTSNIVASTMTITDTNWHFVVATKSGSTVKLYIDGVDVTGTVTDATIVATGGVTDIGRYVGFAGFNWNGSLAKIGVFSTALTAANVSALYSAGAMAAGARLLLEFDGACILTHSASLILQGAVNYTTAAGDVLEFVSEGSGVWREINRHTATDGLTTHLNDTTDAHDASAISNVPTGTVVATTVQAAIDELAADYASADSTHAAAADPHTVYRLESVALKISHLAVFVGLAESAAVEVLLPRPGICVGESGEHGTFAALRGKATCGTAGTGTNTILIEADDNPAFSSATTLFTLNLGTSTEVDDTTLDNAWASGDIWVRARMTAVGATAPKDLAVQFYFSEEVF